MFWSFFISFLLLAVTNALPAGVYVGQDGTVGASGGGYHANAGLGGILGGAGPRGGLHAQAGTPGGHFAAAGLGGSVSEGSGPQGQLYSVAGHGQPTVITQPEVVAQPVGPAAAAPASSSAHSKASASASSSSGGAPAVIAPAPAAGSNSQASASSSGSSLSGFQGGVAPVYGNKRPGSFFDDIFNIPISTLGAVNQYLNNRQRVAVVPVGVAQVQQPAKASQTNAFASSSASSSSSASASSNSGADSGSSGVIDNNIYHGGIYSKNPNYNDIFNIPISVLGAVNRFLNG